MPNQKKTVTESYKKSAAAVSKGRGTKQSRRTSAQNAALFGILTALALALGYVESLVPVYLGAPGVKLGLANLVTMVGARRKIPAGLAPGHCGRRPGRRRPERTSGTPATFQRFL